MLEVVIIRLLLQCRQEMIWVLMVTWMLMLLHVDITCFQKDESSTCTFQFVDVSKLKINISLIILTITKFYFLRLNIDTAKTPAINSSLILMYLELCFSWTWQFMSKPVGFYNLISCILGINFSLWLLYNKYKDFSRF